MTATDFVLDSVKILFGAFAGSVITKRVQGNAQLITHWGHVSSFTIRNQNQPPITLNTHEVVVRNGGSKPATEVRITHHVLPNDFNIFPPIPYTIDTLPNGAKDIVIQTLVPKQQITISYLYYPPLLASQIHAGVRSMEGFASEVEMEISEKTAPWLLIAAGLLMLIGLLTTLYFGWKAVAAVLSRLHAA